MERLTEIMNPNPQSTQEHGSNYRSILAKLMDDIAQKGECIDTTKETPEERRERLKNACEAKCKSLNDTLGNRNEEDGYNCDICKNKGYIYKVGQYLDGYVEMQSDCKCQKVRKTILAMKRSGLEDVVHDFTFDKYIATEPWQQEVLTTAKEYVANHGEQWFFFGGASGAGKSHLCTATTISLLKQGNDVKYMLWRDDASRLKAMVNDSTYAGEMEVYKNIDVLYIDDLFKTGKTEAQGKQRPTQADINLAFEILNSRYMQKKITIISSESTMTDLIDIDEAIAGRIKQKCGDYCINIAPDRSKNYRLK